MKTKALLAKLLVFCLSITMTLTMVPVYSFAETTDGASDSNQQTEVADGTTVPSDEASEVINEPADENDQKEENADATDADVPTEDASADQEQQDTDTDTKAAGEVTAEPKSDEKALPEKANEQLLGAPGDTKAGGADLSQYLTVSNLTINNLTDDEELILLDNQSDDPGDYPTTIPSNGKHFQFIIDWGMNLTDGVIHAGDTATIPMTIAPMTCSLTSWIEVTDSSDKVVYKYQISKTGISIEFGEGAEGANKIPNARFDTGQNLITTTNSSNTAETFYKITVGNISGYTCRDAHADTLSANKLNDTKYISSKTNDKINWGTRHNYVALAKLWNSKGTESPDNVVRKNYIYEDTFEDGVEIIGFTMYGRIMMPVDYTGQKKGVSTYNASASSNLVPLFTKLEQNAGESYEDFKARIASTPLQYGYYTADDGTPSIIVNFGDLGNQPELKYTQKNITTAVNQMIKMGYIPEEDKDLAIENFTTAFLNNSINGCIPMVNMYVGVRYEPVYGDTDASRSVYNKDDRNWDGGGLFKEVTTTISAIASELTLSGHSVGVRKQDAGTRLAIKGASFKLQRQGADGTWADYEAEDGGELVRETGVQGTATFGALAYGHYRMVETKAATGYDLSKTVGYDSTDKVAYVKEFDIDDNSDTGQVIAVENSKATVDVSATKAWDDNNNKYNKRPANITFRLYQKVGEGQETEVEGSAQTIPKTASGASLKKTWKGKDLYDAEGNEISYSVKEDPADFYDTEVTSTGDNQYKVTNTIRVDEVKLVSDEVVFDGAKHKLADGTSKYNGKVLYSTDKNKWSETMPEFTDVGEHTVYAKTEEGTAEDGKYVGSEVTSAVLKITPAAVKVTADDKEKTYGDADPAWTSTADGLVGTTKKIAELITLTYTREPGENVGEYKITVSGPEAFGNYTFTYEQGKLNIVQKAITIIADSGNKEYDGSALTNNTVKTDPALADGDKIDSVTVIGSQTKVGMSDNVPSDAKIVNEAGEDVTENYDITYASGQLTVTVKPLTITADSGKKVYDGEPLTIDTYTSDELADGDSFESVTVTGSQTEIGKSDNVPSDAIIVNTAGEVVTANYDITYKNGELEVTPIPTAKITYDLNGGSYNGSTENIVEVHEVGEVITIHPAPTRAGYEFSYWQGSEYQPGDSYTVSEDHTFKAVWVAAADKNTDKNKDKNKDNNGAGKNASKTKGVKTGDETNIGLWITLMILTAGCLAGTLVYRRRKSDN